MTLASPPSGAADRYAVATASANGHVVLGSGVKIAAVSADPADSLVPQEMAPAGSGLGVTDGLAEALAEDVAGPLGGATADAEAEPLGEAAVSWSAGASTRSTD